MRGWATLLAAALYACDDETRTVANTADSGASGDAGETSADASTSGAAGDGGRAGAPGSTAVGGAHSGGGAAGEAGETGEGGAAGEAPELPASVRLTTYVGTVQQDVPWLAVQDGDGPWQRLGGAAGSYVFESQTGRYGVAWVCEFTEGMQTTVEIDQLTVAEAPAHSVGCHKEGATHAVSGRLAGVGADRSVAVHIGSTSVTTSLGAASYLGRFFDAGVWDVTAVRRSATQAERVIVLRDRSLRADTEIDFDFSAEGHALGARPLTVLGAASSETISTFVGFRPHRSGAFVPFTAPPSTALFLPATALAGNDVHTVAVTAADDALRTARRVERFLRAGADLSLTLPQAFEPSVSVTAGSAQLLFRVSFEARASADLYRFAFDQYDSARQWSLRWVARVSRGWLGATGALSYTFPELALLDGWSAANDPLDGVEVAATLEERRSTRGLGAHFVFPEGRIVPVTPAGLDGLEVASSRKTVSLLP